MDDTDENSNDESESSGSSESESDGNISSENSKIFFVNSYYFYLIVFLLRRIAEKETWK